MADLARIKNNVRKMAAQNAPEADIDGYIASEGVSVDDVRNFTGAPQQPVQPQQPEAPGYGMDMLKGAASGLRSGVEGLAGAVGSANQLTGQGAGWLAGKLGAGPGMQEFVQNVGRRANLMPFMPSTDEIAGGTDAAVNAVPGSKSFQDVTRYQPQTLPGKIVRTAAEIAPNMVAGPGGALRKTAMTAASSVGSELAGAATEGTAAEPWARAGGMIAGGGLAAGRNPSLVKMAAEGAPTQEVLKTQTNRLYEGLRSAGIKYDPNAYTSTVTKMVVDLRKKGFRPVGRVKEAFDWVRQMADEVGNSPSFDDINSLRTSIGEAARDAYRSQDGKSLGKALDIVKNHLDDFEGKAAFVSDKPLPPEQFNKIRSAARDLALRSIKQRSLDEVMAKADTYSAGRDAGIRNGIGNLLRSKRGMQLFNADERQALLDVEHNRKGLRSLSRFGIDFEKASGNATLLPTIGASSVAGAATMAGIPASIAAGGLVAAGTAAKFAGPRLTTRAMEQVGGAIRSGKMNSPELAKSAKALRNQKFIRQLLAAGMPTRQPLELTVRQPSGQ